MNYYAELKRLAEAATKGPWSYDGSYVCPARVEGGTTYVETWRSVADCAQPENTKFIAAANPAAVLVMIAEITRLYNREYDLACLADSRHAIMIDLENQRDLLRKVLVDVREALGREYWDQYAGLDETRDILDAALGKELVQ